MVIGAHNTCHRCCGKCSYRVINYETGFGRSFCSMCFLDYSHGGCLKLPVNSWVFTLKVHSSDTMVPTLIWEYRGREDCVNSVVDGCISVYTRHARFLIPPPPP